ncbi:class I SAM-dependent methyltransferase [Geminocystis sp. GBBB08]|uniref:class I SAM-dependent methyltransferase n=1 Tax=Geminocystis sp. GBBB08 TaxID=2604140 RepID=UPI0027E2A9A3|nr:class I SAM-dependent methyltransferase [Geminocystis sp. GBBB08]MBL1210548.1 class I SAM-dependent methyltransferase [Geminocystis sp. GBBB08]
MFKNYQNIFDQRGMNYHQAMIKYPSARKDEFQNAIKLLDLQNNHLLLDIPSGGCYISNFIDHNLTIFSTETSKQFINHSQIDTNNNILICNNFNNIPLNSNSIDRVLSLAALHHIEDKISFYQEIYRLLKNDSIFCIGDVLEGSKVANFLNIFVDKNNSMGHEGSFLTEKIKLELENIKFNVIYDSVINYYWYFESFSNMIDFCKLLFGLDKANDQQIEKGIDHYLGYFVNNNKCYMNWELYFVKAIKS